jgi:hypothetical protein
VEVEGTPDLDVDSYTGTAPVMSLAFSESKTYLRAPGSEAITGDSAFQPRAVSLTVSADGTLSTGFMGGFRFEAITLTTPGTVVLHGAGLRFGGGYLATASDYQGYFLSSSKAFNTMFYDGAYTEQTDMQPAGTSGAAQPSVLDGAKRDRAIWSGDLKIEGQGIADTLGTNGDNYVKQSLLTLITSSQQEGGLNADTLGRTGPYSNSYSSWTLDAATTYYRNTGDTAFARQILPWLEGQLAYDATLTGANGLIVTGPQISTTDGGYDWDFYDGAKTGTVTAFNDLYYQSLRDVAYTEASLGNTAKAAAYDQTADHVRNAINASLLDPATGTYYLSDTGHSTFAQDAGALSVLFGVASAAKVPRHPRRAEEPVGTVRLGAVLRHHLQQPHQPVHHRIRDRGRLPGGRHQRRRAPDASHLGPDDRPAQPVLHRDHVVATPPGSTRPTRTCRWVTSWRRDSVNPFTPNLVRL